MIIDLSVYKKEDLEIKSLKGTTYTIPGNFSTDFYINLLDKYQKLDAKKNSSPAEYIKIAKDFALEILSLDKTKTITSELIEEEFNDINVLRALLTGVMNYANEISNDPLQ